MDHSGVDIESKFVDALRSQGKAEYPLSGALPCPYPGHHGRTFQSVDQVYDYAKTAAQSSTGDQRRLGKATHILSAGLKSARQSLPVAPNITRLSFDPPITDRPACASGQRPPAPAPMLPHRTNPVLRPPRYQPGLIELQRYGLRYPGLFLQPNPRPLSQEQLASEVKSIYAGLTMVETKCIHVDRAQAEASQSLYSEQKLASGHWQALIALHRTLLHKHHDFFLASQHPSASPALRLLANKYSMPARMWKHGIHSFLELLRRRLPDSVDYMLAFICSAYQIMALLYETVHTLEDTWVEYLGDLGRYRMAIEAEDIRDRETWAGVARSWYSKAVEKNPSIGRLYHHLAILSRPNALPQLYYQSGSRPYLTHPLDTRESTSIPSIPPLVRSNSDDWRFHIVALNQELLLHVKRSSKDVLLSPHMLHDTGPLDPGRHMAEQDLEHSSQAVCDVRLWAGSHEASRIWQRLERELRSTMEIFSRSLKLVLPLLDCNKRSVAAYLCASNIPIVLSAGNPPGNSTPTSNQVPLFRFETIFDFAMLGVMALYCLTMLALRLKTSYFSTAFHVSYALMISTGLLSYVVNRDDFASPIRTTVLEIWFATSFHVVVQHCYDNYNPLLHIASFFVLSTIYGIALLQYPAKGPLDVLPPYMSLAALALFAVHELKKFTLQRQPLVDVEHVHGAVELHNRGPSASDFASVNTGHNNNTVDPIDGLVRRNSNLSRNHTTNPLSSSPN